MSSGGNLFILFLADEKQGSTGWHANVPASRGSVSSFRKFELNTVGCASHVVATVGSARWLTKINSLCWHNQETRRGNNQTTRPQTSFPICILSIHHELITNASRHVTCWYRWMNIERNCKPWKIPRHAYTRSFSRQQRKASRMSFGTFGEFCSRRECSWRTEIRNLNDSWVGLSVKRTECK